MTFPDSPDLGLAAIRTGQVQDNISWDPKPYFILRDGPINLLRNVIESRRASIVIILQSGFSRKNRILASPYRTFRVFSSFFEDLSCMRLLAPYASKNQPDGPALVLRFGTGHQGTVPVPTEIIRVSGSAANAVSLQDILSERMSCIDVLSETVL